MTTDTIKVCLTTFGDLNGITFTCMQCDSLVYGPNGWMVMNMGNPTGVNELEINAIGSKKIYDLDVSGLDINTLNFPERFIPEDIHISVF